MTKYRYDTRQWIPCTHLEQIRRMRGGAQSHLMRCTDKDNNEFYYVVKFQNNPQHTRILVNEMLGTRLASHLGLPTTSVAVVCVSEELIRLTPDLCVELPRQRIPLKPGLHFGSRFPGDPHRLTLFDFLPDPLLMSVENLHDFAGMLVFDKWTCNTNGGQTLFYRKEGAAYRTVMIDQGFCFNAEEWNFPDAPLRGLYARNKVYEGVTGRESFGPWLEASGTDISPGDALQRMLEKWNSTLSNAIQLAPQKGVYAADLEAETDRLYGEQVAPPRSESRAGAPGSRSTMRQYCSQVWRQSRLWERIEKSVRVQEFTFPGDPMRLDYGYRHNGTRGFVQLLSVTRSPKDCKELAYTADRIARRARFASEFVAVTDVALQQQNERHRFVNDTLREAGIEAVPMEGFAVWVAKLKPMIQ